MANANSNQLGNLSRPMGDVSSRPVVRGTSDAAAVESSAISASASVLHRTHPGTSFGAFEQELTVEYAKLKHG